MKKYISMLLCITLIICLAGCADGPSPTTAPSTESTSAATDATSASTQAQPEQDASAVYDAPMASVSMPLIVETQCDDTGKAIAYYTHQDVSIVLPDADVAEAISLDLLNRIDKTRTAAEALFDTAKLDYSNQSNWYPYSYAIAYETMRLDQNVLSFFGTEASFDGSPRSMQTGISITYDLTIGEPLTLRGILHEENYADALCDLIIDGLKSTASDSLFSDYENIIRGKFSTNVPVESWYFSDRGLCFYFAPYEIASYAAGTVISEIPYNKLSGLLKDQYFPGESLVYSGTLTAKRISPDDTNALEKYTQFAEITVNPDAEQILITTDGSASNIKLRYSTNMNACGITECTILSLPGMGPTDAILLTVDAEHLDGKIIVSFESQGETQTLELTQEKLGVLKFAK